MADNPAFAVTPRVSAVNIATQNTARDGTGTVATLITGAANGTQIREIVVKARVTTTAGMVRIFLHDGSTFFLFDEITDHDSCGDTVRHGAGNASQRHICESRPAVIVVVGAS